MLVLRRHVTRPAQEPPSDGSGRSEPGSSPVAARELSSERRLAMRRPAWTVRLPETPIVLPMRCACCAAPRSRELRISDGAGCELLVGYCEECALHAARATTRRLSVTIASLLAGIAVASALPIALPWLSLATCAGLSLAAALSPLAFDLVRRRPLPGHSSADAAAVFVRPRELRCSDHDFALELGRAIGATVASVPMRRLAGRLDWVVVAVVAFGVAPFAYTIHHPLVRVLNLGALPVTLHVDGRVVGRVEPSSGESPFAGLELRLPAGTRTLELMDTEGRSVARTQAEIVAARRHLYAPAAAETGTCFWLESIGYGRAPDRGARVPLIAEDGFFSLPTDVNGWFLPTAPAAPDSRSTGGRSTVLRQGPCDEEPQR